MPVYRINAGPSYAIQQWHNGRSSMVGGVANIANYAFSMQDRNQPQPYSQKPRTTRPTALFATQAGLKYTGALCWDETWGVINPRLEASNPPFMHIPAIVTPTPLEANQYSRWDAEAVSGSGGDGDNIFSTVVGDYVYYMVSTGFIVPSNNVGTKWRAFYTHGDVGIGAPAIGPSTGNIALAFEVTSAGVSRTQIRLAYFDGAVWQEGALNGTALSLAAANHQFMIEVHVPSKVVKLWWSTGNGVPVAEQTLCEITMTVAPLCESGTVATYIYAGVGIVTNFRHRDYTRAEGIAVSDRPPYMAGPTIPHTYAYYPISIGDSDAWTPTRSCADVDKWRTVRDPMYSREPSSLLNSTYIEATGTGAPVDQLFGIDFVAADNPGAEIVGVYIAAANNSYFTAGGVVPQFVLMKQNAVLDPQAGLGNGYWKYYYWPLAPDGTPWTAAKLETAQVGVRVTTLAVVNKCSYIVVGVVGTNLNRPPIILECPFIEPGMVQFDQSPAEIPIGIVKY